MANLILTRTWLVALGNTTEGIASALIDQGILLRIGKLRRKTQRVQLQLPHQRLGPLQSPQKRRQRHKPPHHHGHRRDRTGRPHLRPRRQRVGAQHRAGRYPAGGAVPGDYGGVGRGEERQDRSGVRRGGGGGRCVVSALSLLASFYPGPFGRGVL